MLIAAAAFGAFLCAACIVGFIRPALLTNLVPWFLKLRWAMLLRRGRATADWRGADPRGTGLALPAGVPGIIGWLMIVAAVVLPIVGRERIVRLVNWVAAWPAVAMRAWLIVGFAFGAFLVYGTGLF